jgi:hypothetical protein
MFTVLRHCDVLQYFLFSFRGVQKQLVNAEPTNSDPESVQGILEICSKRFKPVNEPCVKMSSR